MLQRMGSAWFKSLNLPMRTVPKWSQQNDLNTTPLLLYLLDQMHPENHEPNWSGLNWAEKLYPLHITMRPKLNLMTNFKVYYDFYNFTRYFHILHSKQYKDLKQFISWNEGQLLKSFGHKMWDIKLDAMRQHFTRPAVKGQQPGDRRGYFYESVGGVYYTLEWPLKVRVF